MKRDSNIYIFLYATGLVLVVAVLLAMASTSLRPRQQENVKMEKRLDILKSIGQGEEEYKGDDKQQWVAELFQKYVRSEEVVNLQGVDLGEIDAFGLDFKAELAKGEEGRFPVFIATLDNGEKKYILPLAGQGLWGPIWGYIALNDDLNTVYGVSFAHKSETPGLGAEIVTQPFRAQFAGKQIFSNGVLSSLQVVKGGGTERNAHAVDAISGGTRTSKGVEAMLLNSLQAYKAFIARQKEGK